MKSVASEDYCQSRQGPHLRPRRKGSPRACHHWLAAGGLFSCWLSVARAQEPLRVALQYDVDSALSNCPSEGEFRHRVIDEVGRNPFDDNAAIRIIAHFGESSGEIVGRIEWKSPSGASLGERQLALQTQDCGEFSQKMAFAVAVQIQLLNLSAPTVPHELNTGDSMSNGKPIAIPTKPASSPKTLESPKVPVTPTRTVSHASARTRVMFGFGPLLAAGWSPASSVGVEGYGAVKHDSFSMALGFKASLPNTYRRTDGSGFESRVAMLSLAPCGHIDRVAACGVVNVGTMYVRGLGVDVVRSASGLVVQPGLRLSLSQPVGRHFACAVFGEFLGNTRRWAVRLDKEDVWSAPRAVYLGGVSASLSF